MAKPRLSLEELEFLRTEIYSSLSCGAEDPLFEKVYAKLDAIIRGRGGSHLKREFKPDSQSDAVIGPGSNPNVQKSKWMGDR